MKKIVIRTKPVCAIASRIASKGGDLSAVINKFGEDYVLKNIFEEEISFQELKKECTKFMQTGESDMFAFMYWISPEFGAVIDHHIHLLHRLHDEKAVTVKCFDWEYMESKEYWGDSWWFEEEEILSDLTTFTLPAFLEKYKGY